MKTIQVELAQAVPYANGSGEEVPGSFIEITEPTGKIAHLVGLIKTEVGASTKAAFTGIDLGDAADIDDSDDSEQTAEQIGDGILGVMMVGNADMERFYVTLKEILKATGKIGGEKPFTAPMFDRMAYTDVETVAKAYLGHFIKASD